MSIIEQSRDEYGLNRCLQALGVAKSSWHYRQKGSGRRGAKEKEMESEMRHILEDHPDYGRPRMTVELRERLGYRINHKRVERLLRHNGWGMIRHIPRRSKSGVQQIRHHRKGNLDKVSGREFGVLEAFSTDFTELRYAQGRHKAWLMTLSDLESRAGRPAGRSDREETEAWRFDAGSGPRRGSCNWEVRSQGSSCITIRIRSLPAMPG